MAKYGNRKTTVNGIEFDSKREANRYVELTYLLRAGLIKDLQTQVPYVLMDGFRKDGRAVRAITYIADFIYTDEHGKTVVEDAKGHRTKEYLIKKKLFEWRYPELTISEV